MTDRTCTVCGRLHYARGYCRLHWDRWRRDGDPGPPGRLPPGPQRVYSDLVRLSVTVERRQVEALDAWAEEREMSRSEAVREALDRLIGDS